MRKTHLWENTTWFEGGGGAFFVGIEVLNNFHVAICRKKNNIFFQITAKNYFWGHIHFWGNGALDDKIKCNLFGGNGVLNTVFMFFPQETP